MSIKLFDLSEMRALITGGGGGIGFEIAKGLGQAGAEIIISGRDSQKLNAAVAELNGIGIEMETSAVFGAAKLVGIKAGALLEVSDVTINGKNLFSGRTKEDTERRRLIRESVMAKAILESIID